MRVYELIVRSDTMNTVYLFAQQPAREQIVDLFTKIWRQLSPEVQDESWDLLLLAYLCPEKPWLGIWKNDFGLLQCKVHGVIT